MSAENAQNNGGNRKSAEVIRWEIQVKLLNLEQHPFFFQLLLSQDSVLILQNFFKKTLKKIPIGAELCGKKRCVFIENYQRVDRKYNTRARFCWKHTSEQESSRETDYSERELHRPANLIQSDSKRKWRRLRLTIYRGMVPTRDESKDLYETSSYRKENRERSLLSDSSTKGLPFEGRLFLSNLTPFHHLRNRAVS